MIVNRTPTKMALSKTSWAAIPSWGLTVELRGRPDAPNKAPLAHTVSRASGADTHAVHGPLHRLLGALREIQQQGFTIVLVLFMELQNSISGVYVYIDLCVSFLWT